MRIVIIFLSIVCYQYSISQNIYLVYLNEKDTSKSKLALSDYSIQRKAKYNIAIDAKDYSIESYKVDIISPYTISTTSIHWLNALSVTTDDKSIESIKKMPFVTKVELLKKDINTRSKSSNKKMYSKEEYGESYTQINIHHGEKLHDSGYTGEGMKIAVLDAGFNKIDSIYSIQYLFNNKRIHPVKNIVYNNADLYSKDNHGTYVMGCMASFIKDTIIGSAPNADYYLFITEDARSETRAEELYWAIGAQMADSIGVDIINSSLGYSEFDDKSTNYTYQDMDGKTTIVSKAAQIACDKGMIVVNSAGNMGNNKWHYITAPADVKDVVTVGAIDIGKNIADFSSRGYNAVNVIKPNVMAVGKNATVFYDNGNYVNSSGTSFSSPIMAGLIACYWQKNRNLDPKTIKYRVEQCSNLFLTPNTDFGFGIPDFALAMQLDNKPISTDSNLLILFPNPTYSNQIKINYNSTKNIDNAEIEIYHLNKRIYTNKIAIVSGLNQYYFDVSDHSKGMFFVLIKLENRTIYSRFEKL